MGKHRRRGGEYKSARRAFENFRHRMRVRRSGERITYGCSRHVMFYLSVYGFIPCMNEREFRRRFCRGARDALRLDEAPPEAPTERKAKARYGKRRKKRKLMPQDYAWLLRSEGRKYDTVSASYSRGAQRVHKPTGYELRDRARERAVEFWESKVQQFKRQKANARIRLLRRRLGLATPHEIATAKRKSTRHVSVRISRPLYEAIVYGECVSFNWREVRGHERDFLPDSSGRPVDVVSVRPPGNDPDYDWVSFGVTGLERFYREGDGWFWRIGVGDLVECPGYGRE